MKEYKLYQHEDKWIMEEIENGEVVYAVLGDDQIDCFEQMFPRIWEEKFGLLDTVRL